MCVGALSPAFPKIYLFSNLLTRFGVHIHLSHQCACPVCPPGHAQSLGRLLAPWATANLHHDKDVSFSLHFSLESCWLLLHIFLHHCFKLWWTDCFDFCFVFILFHGIRLGCQFNLHVNVFLLNTPYYHFFSYSFSPFLLASSWFLEECGFFLAESFIGSLCRKERNCVWC